jgi:acetyl-CoA C-acetyltransferase
MWTSRWCHRHQAGAEIVEQLRGDAGKRQVDGAEIGMTHNVGGSGATAVVHIFSRDR